MFRPADAVTALQPQDVNVFSPLKLRNALHLRMAMRVSNSERRRGGGRSGTHLMVQGYDWFLRCPVSFETVQKDRRRRGHPCSGIPEAKV